VNNTNDTNGYTNGYNRNNSGNASSRASYRQNYSQRGEKQVRFNEGFGQGRETHHCYFCGKQGHLQDVCFLAEKQPWNRPQNSRNMGNY